MHHGSTEANNLRNYVALMGKLSLLIEGRKYPSEIESLTNYYINPKGVDLLKQSLWHVLATASTQSDAIQALTRQQGFLPNFDASTEAVILSSEQSTSADQQLAMDFYNINTQAIETISMNYAPQVNPDITVPLASALYIPASQVEVVSELLARQDIAVLPVTEMITMAANALMPHFVDSVTLLPWWWNCRG